MRDGSGCREHTAIRGRDSDPGRDSRRGPLLAGRSSTDGILVDMSALDDIDLGGADGVATIGAGARSGRSIRPCMRQGAPYRPGAARPLESPASRSAAGSACSGALAV